MQLPLTIRGKVIHGEQVGRTIGFPTANIDVALDETTIDAGVYVGTCTVAEKRYACLPYFGPRLIFGETKNVFEVYIFDFDKDIYNKEIEITLLQFQRGPIQVNSLEELKTLLESDKENGQTFFQDYSEETS